MMDLEISISLGLFLTTIWWAFVGDSSSFAPLRVLIVVSAAVYLLFKAYRVFVYPRFLSPLRHLPGPKNGHFLIGQMANQLLTPGPIDIYLDWMRRWPESHLIRHLSVANSEVLLVNSVAALKEIQVTRAYSFRKPGIAARMFSPVTGIGLMFSEGDVHKRHRNQLRGPFSLRNVQKMLPVFQSKAKELCQSMNRNIGDENHRIVEVEPWFQKAALDILSIASIGYDLESLSTPYACFYEVYHRIIHQSKFGHILTFVDGHVPLRSWLPLRSNRQWLKDNLLIRQMLLEKLKLQKDHILSQKELEISYNTTTQGKDLLTFMLEDIQRSPAQESWDDWELLDFLLNFIAGGHETIGTAMMWSSYVLASSEHVQIRLHEEISGLFRDKDPKWLPEYADIENLEYLNNFVRELLRVYSPALFLPRESSEDVTICGTFIPRGTTIILCPAVTHFNPLVWGPDAESFVPERWDRRGEKGSSASDQYAFAPFLHGPKGCIGRSFALLALKVTIVETVRNFRFTQRPEDRGKRLDFANPNFTLRPKEGLKVVLERRIGGVHQ